MKFLFLIISLFYLNTLFAQDDLLQSLQSKNTKHKVSSTFKSIKLINFETTKLVPKKHLNFIIAHRFGSIQNGFEDLFGLDAASTRIQFIYGITDNLNVSFSRSRLNRTYDFATKYRIKTQETNGFPVTINGYHLLAINTALSEDDFSSFSFDNRLGYTSQLIVAHKFSSKASIQVSPTLLYEGLTFTEDEDNLQYAIGFGGRLLFTKRVALIADYGLHLNRASSSRFNNPLALGVEIETGGHVFQLTFSNAQGLFENAFINRAEGSWEDLNIFFGFNLNRTFDLKKRKKVK